ncbi:MAG TPA: FAD-dependent oxidoreductase [Gemmatimonadales bacterium]|nr:FAD-dependent oxidoreductase [Gemmatimonadales bacterium]
MKVVVVGAGIAGLTAAWELTQSGGCDVTLLESERRAGGVIVTEQMDGFIVEGGPDGFLAGEPELPALARELGISDHVVRQVARGTSLWTGKALQPIDEGQAAALLGIDAAKAEVAKGFSTFAEGMAEPVAALAQRLAASLRFAQGVAGIIPDGKRWRIAITGGSAHEADGVVLALPAFAAGRLLEGVGVAHGRALAEVVYAPSITVSLAYRTEQVGNRLDGAGFVVDPDVVGARHVVPLQIRACTYASQKFPGRAPHGHVLLRAYLPPLDGDPATAAHAQLAAILGIRGEPLWSRVFYWDRGLPRYRAHHAEQVAAVRRRLSRLPPIAIAGAGYDGAGMSACVRSGREAARLMLRGMSVIG